MMKDQRIIPDCLNEMLRLDLCKHHKEYLEFLQIFKSKINVTAETGQTQTQVIEVQPVLRCKTVCWFCCLGKSPFHCLCALSEIRLFVVFSSFLRTMFGISGSVTWEKTYRPCNPSAFLTKTFQDVHTCGGIRPAVEMNLFF